MEILKLDNFKASKSNGNLVKSCAKVITETFFEMEKNLEEKIKEELYGVIFYIKERFGILKFQKIFIDQNFN